MVGDRLLDDRAWNAARRTLISGEEVDVDLTPPRPLPGRSGLSVRGHVRLLAEEDRRFAVIFVTDDSELARMEATRRDFVANVCHELKTPVGAMGLLAEALLESADDPETVRRFVEKLQVESQRLGNMVNELIELSRLQGAERLPEHGRREVDAIVAEAHRGRSGRRERRDRDHHGPAQRDARQGRPVAAGTAMTNLVDNAINYSPCGTQVSISPAPARRQPCKSRSPTAASVSRGAPRARLRAVLPGRPGAVPGDRRNRARAGNRQAHVRPTTAGPPAVESPGHRVDVHLAIPVYLSRRTRTSTEPANETIVTKVLIVEDEESMADPLGIPAAQGGIQATASRRRARPH